jgi:plastocyanin
MTPSGKRVKGGRLVSMAAAVALCAAAATCGGGGSSSTPTQPSPGGGAGGGGGGGGGSTDPQATITITADGVSPREVTISAGGRVRFVNNNRIAHDMASDPHPEHTACPGINQVGFIQPTQTRDTAALTAVRTCGFHDHNQPSNETLNGTIVVR